MSGSNSGSLRLEVRLFEGGSREVLKTLNIDERLERRIIQEEAWAQTVWPESDPGPISELIGEDGSVGQRRTIWSYWSDEDGYLAGVCLASSIDEAKRIGFERLMVMRPREWVEYHADPSTIQVELIGDEGGSGDGEGNIEL